MAASISQLLPYAGYVFQFIIDDHIISDAGRVLTRRPTETTSDDGMTRSLAYDKIARRPPNHN